MSVATTTMAGPPAGQSFPVPPAIRPEQTLSPGQWGMLSFLVSEVALFGTLIVTYLFYVGKDVVGPTPAEALSLGLVVCTTACLLASSATVHVAERRLERGTRWDSSGGGWRLSCSARRSWGARPSSGTI